MLRTQVGKGTHRFLRIHHPLFVVCRLWLLSVHVELFIDRAICSLHKTTVLLVALQHCYAERFAIGGHLRDIGGNKGSLDYQIHLTGSLNNHGTVGLTIFFSNSSLSERCVLKQNVHLTVNGTHGGEPVNFANQPGGICCCERRKKLRNLNLFLSAQEPAAARKQKRRD